MVVAILAPAALVTGYAQCTGSASLRRTLNAPTLVGQSLYWTPRSTPSDVFSAAGVRVLRGNFIAGLEVWSWFCIEGKVSPRTGLRSTLWSALEMAPRRIPPPPPPGPPVGTITGRVVDQRGRPVAAAKVTVLPSGPGALVYLLRFVTSDRTGRFKIDRLRFGPYYVYAGKETAGYPGTWNTIYQMRPPPKVSLTASRATASVVVRIGPRAGELEGGIFDAATKRSLPQARFKLTTTPSGLLGIGLASPYRLAVPSEEQVEIEISRPGYKLWTKRLRLVPGERRRLDIYLVPISMR